MLNCPCGIEFEIIDDDPITFEQGTPFIETKDYNRLENKPQINNVTLTGNKFLQDLFPDGILINCGDSVGYPEPVIPPGVPHAKGAGF